MLLQKNVCKNMEDSINTCVQEGQTIPHKLACGAEQIAGSDMICMKKYIHASWQRCRKLGLSPKDSPKPQRISRSKMSILAERYNVLHEVANQYVDKIRLVLPKNCCILGLSDKKGVLVYTRGYNPELERMGYLPGYLHTEANMGNNALGTCIYTQRPISILGEEHFLEGLKKWAGFAVPIYNRDNELEAAIMAMMPVEMVSQNILAMMMAVARGIEKEFILLDEKTELVNAKQMLSEFGDGVVKTASMLSHEIRNSLSNISAYTQLLQLEKPLENGKAEKILTEISRVNKILHDFKRLTKPMQMNFSRHSLNDIIHSTLEIMKPKVNINHILFKSNIPQKHIFIKADKNALQQVFINLIENAIQAMENGGVLSIELNCIDENGDIVILFRDTGERIPVEQIDEIFKLFYTTKKTGSGLGLALCQCVIKHHGGDIKVDSTMGEGTAFTITFPRNIEIEE